MITNKRSLTESFIFFHTWSAQKHDVHFFFNVMCFNDAANLQQ